MNIINFSKDSKYILQTSEKLEYYIIVDILFYITHKIFTASNNLRIYG